MRLLKAATETVGQEITKQDAISLIRKKLLHSLSHVLPSICIGTSLVMNVSCSALVCGVLSSSLVKGKNSVKKELVEKVGEYDVQSL